MTDPSPATTTLTLAAAGLAASKAPLLAEAVTSGFGEGQDPRPMLAWYAIGGLAFLVMLARNAVGFFSDLGEIRGRKKRQRLEKDGQLPPATQFGVDWQTHNREVSEVHQKVDRLETDLMNKMDEFRRELAGTLQQQGNSITAVASDAAAAKAGAKATNDLLRDLVKRMTKGGAVT